MRWRYEYSMVVMMIFKIIFTSKVRGY